MESEALVQWNPPQDEATSGDLLVKSRLCNAVLHDAVKNSGLSQKEYCRPMDIAESRLSALMTLRLSPWNLRTGERKDFAEALAEHIQIPFNDLFPRTLYALRVMVPPEALERRYDSVELVPLLEARNVRVLENPSEIYDKKELQEEIQKALSSLSPREEFVLKNRFGLEGNPLSLKQIGNFLNVSRERIRQIETEGLKKLRQPQHSKGLQDLLAVKRGGVLKPCQPNQ